MNVIHLVSNKTWGGGERYALDLCKALRSEGYNVTALTRNSPAVRDVFGAEGLLGGTLALGGAFDIISPLSLSRRLNRLEGPTVIHVHNFKDARTALSARKLAKNPADIRVVCTRHLVKAAKTDRSHLALYNDLDAIIFVSNLARDEFMSTSPDVDKRKIHVVYNGSVAPAHTHMSAAPGEPVKLIFAARITPEKGLGVLIDALDKLQDLDWHLTVCGTGRSTDVMPIVRKSRALGLAARIDWPGHVDNVADDFYQWDIMTAPSLVRESFGLTIIEAMSAEVPAVTTDNGAQTEIITDGHDGLLVTPDNPEALADALRKLISDPGLRLNMGKNARNTWQEKFSFARFFNQITQIYHDKE